MVDIENEVFTAVATVLRERFSNIKVESATNYNPSKFPCACIEEVDNSVLRTTQDSGSNENHVTVVYEVNAYSNKTTGKKKECKAIIAAIDEVLIGLGFTRTTKAPFNLDDATKYRIFNRYTAVVSKDKIIYRR